MISVGNLAHQVGVTFRLVINNKTATDAAIALAECHITSYMRRIRT